MQAEEYSLAIFNPRIPLQPIATLIWDKSPHSRGTNRDQILYPGRRDIEKIADRALPTLGVIPTRSTFRTYFNASGCYVSGSPPEAEWFYPAEEPQCLCTRTRSSDGHKAIANEEAIQGLAELLDTNYVLDRRATNGTHRPRRDVMQAISTGLGFIAPMLEKSLK